MIVLKMMCILSQNLDIEKISERLQIADNKALTNGHCPTCDASTHYLKQEALSMVQFIQQAQNEGPKSGIKPPNTYARFVYNIFIHFLVRNYWNGLILIVLYL